MNGKIRHILILTGFLSIAVCHTHAQPELNLKQMDYNVTIYGNVLLHNDSNYIVAGITTDTNTNKAMAIFKSIDFDGGEAWRIELSDSLDLKYWEWPSLIQTLDSNYVAIGTFGKYYHFTKFTPQGGTLFTKVIDDFWVNDSMNSILPGEIIRNESDSSFYVNVHTQKSGELGKATFLRLDKNGNVMYYNYFNPTSQLSGTSHGGFSKINDTTLAFAILERDLPNIPLVNRVSRSVVLFLDTLGNEYNRWTDFDNTYNELRTMKIFPTAGGG